MNTRRRLQVLKVSENGRLAIMPDKTPEQRAARREVARIILLIDEILSHEEDVESD